MENLDKTGIRALLAEAKKFCATIDKYIELLGLNQREVGTFIVDVELLRYVFNNEESFTESFLSYNAISIQSRLTNLIVECTLSDNYTAEIGKKLGIEIPIDNTRGLETDMHLKWSTELSYSEHLLGKKNCN